MTTLVIHPADPTTDFLSKIYEGTDWTVQKNPISKSALKELIKAHDRIIMMGHGTGYGCGAMKDWEITYMIDSTYVYLLREKDCVCIWCNANEFVEKYGLKGIYTGMIISEPEEAEMFKVKCEPSHIVESNHRFTDTMTECVRSNSIDKAIELYDVPDNPIIQYNKNNIFKTL